MDINVLISFLYYKIYVTKKNSEKIEFFSTVYLKEKIKKKRIILTYMIQLS